MRPGETIILISFVSLLAGGGGYALGWDEGVAAQVKLEQQKIDQINENIRQFNQTHRCLNWPP